MANLHASVSLAKIPRPPPFFMTSASGQVISQPATLGKNMATKKIKLFLKHYSYYLQVALLNFKAFRKSYVFGTYFSTLSLKMKKFIKINFMSRIVST